MNPAIDHCKHLVLMITYNCNLRCKYCYENHIPNKSMMIDDAIHNIELCFKEISLNPWYNRLEIIFMGGEPLLEWHKITSIVETIESRKDWPLPYHFFMATNGTLLTEEMKLWIEPRKGHFILGISTDGNSEMQNVNRCNSSRSIDLQYFIQTWPNQAPKVTISHWSLPQLANGIIYLHEKGFKKIQANLAMGQNWTNDDLKLYAEQLEILSNYYIENPRIQRCSLLGIDLIHALNLQNTNRKFCGCGEIMTCIDTDGKEYPCQMFAPITISHQQILDSKKIDFKNHAIFDNPKCSDCLLNLVCPRCYGMAFKLTGDITYRESFLCKAFKIQFLSNCKLTEKRIGKSLLKDDEDEEMLLDVIRFVKKYMFH